MKRTKESSPPQGSFQPLIDQLEKTAKDLKSSGSQEEAGKLDKAAADIRGAASLDLTIIDRAASTVSKQVEPCHKCQILL